MGVIISKLNKSALHFTYLNKQYSYNRVVYLLTIEKEFFLLHFIKKIVRKERYLST